MGEDHTRTGVRDFVIHHEIGAGNAESWQAIADRLAERLEIECRAQYLGRL